MIDKLIIFTLNDCNSCQKLKTKLTESSIQYREIEVSENSPLWFKITEEIGVNVVPTTLIVSDKNENVNFYVPGVNYKDHEEIIEIIKTHI